MIEEFCQELHQITMVKTSGPIRYGTEYTHLKRYMACTRDEIVCRSNPRYVSSVKKVLGARHGELWIATYPGHQDQQEEQRGPHGAGR